MFKTKILILCVVFIAMPMGHYGVQKAEAQFLNNLLDNLLGSVIGGGETVRVVSDTSETSVRTALEGALSRAFQAITSGELQSINLKETVLDPIAWNMAKQLQQQMTGDMLKWLGGQQPGQEGQVPFVQNYSEYYREVLDQTAGEFIFGSELEGLCSEEERFQVQQAVYNDYIKSRSGQELFSCQEENQLANDVPLLERMFRDTVNCDGVTACATYKAEHQLAVRQANAVANERQVLDYSRGMLPQRVCEVVNDPDGRPRQLCEIVNPPFLAADSVSFQLTEMPGLQLLQVDEFNEVISNFMNQLTNEAVLGISSLANNVDFAGVLGLSGNEDYTNLLFGPDGALSYVEALLQDDISQYQSGGTAGGSSAIVRTLEIEQKSLALQNKILSDISRVEEQNNTNKNDYGSCYDLSLSSELQNAKENATNGKKRSEAAIEILNTLKELYDNAENATVRNAAVSEYANYRSQDLFTTEQKNKELEITFVNHTLEILLSQFEYDMEAERSSCGGSSSQTEETSSEGGTENFGGDTTSG